MKKFAVVSGFLGSGKTTSMMALTKYFTEHHGKAAMISNDLGGPGLADNKLAKLKGCEASELTGTCICYQTENLVARLNKLFDEDGCELVLSDIPGFGVGALDHVYHKLSKEYPGQFPLAPFIALCEPRTVEALKNDEKGDLSYIFNSQLKEADLIVLNKCDLLKREEKESMLAFLKSRFPQADNVGISARTGEGLEELSLKLINNSASMQNPDLGYGGSDFISAMGNFSEFYIQYYAEVCCETFDGNAYIKEIGQRIQEKIAARGSEIPHLKLLAWEPEGDYAKFDVLGKDREIECTSSFKAPCRSIAVVINTSAMCASDALDKLINDVIEEISEKYQLTLMTYKKECFAAMGE